MQETQTRSEKRIVRGYELLCVGYAIVAVAVLVLTDFSNAAVVVMGLAGIAVVFAGMMDVLPQIVEHL